MTAALHGMCRIWGSKLGPCSAAVLEALQLARPVDQPQLPPCTLQQGFSFPALVAEQLKCGLFLFCKEESHHGTGLCTAWSACFALLRGMNGPPPGQEHGQGMLGQSIVSKLCVRCGGAPPGRRAARVRAQCGPRRCQPPAPQRRRSRRLLRGLRLRLYAAEAESKRSALCWHSMVC